MILKFLTCISQLETIIYILVCIYTIYIYIHTNMYILVCVYIYIRSLQIGCRKPTSLPCFLLIFMNLLQADHTTSVH